MTPEQWREVERICEGALACAPSERSAYVSAACGGDEALRREVESLLAQEASAEHFIEQPAIAAAGAQALHSNAGERRAVEGEHLGPYVITSYVGAGGMGEVYRARDSRLKRDVALKILPSRFEDEPDRLARFEREAQALAALTHPNIAAIHGFEIAGERRALVLEFVDGETLADRLNRGALPVAEALVIARQIAAALEAAHEQGVIHRDLKPSNIKITRDGVVKILDFGLAKLVSPAHDSTITTSTQTPDLTGAGIVMGTAAYMAPEQALGKTVDKRADIWSFGAVLYEMLSGRCAFDGETLAETIGAVIHKDVDYGRLPANLPQSIHVVLRRCLQKDPKERLRDMGDVRLALDGAFMPERSGKDRTERTRRRGLELVTAACLAAIGTMAATWWLQDATVPDRRSIRFEIPTPDSAQAVAMAPDGRHIAYIARDAARTSWLYVRSLETGETRQIAKTDRPVFWSPDSLTIAFAADGKLKRIDLAGGRPVTLCDVGVLSGGTWTSGDVILFSDVGKGILQVAATGGTPVPRTIVDPKRDRSHFGPWALPDGRHFLYVRTGLAPDKTGIYVGRIDVPPERQDLTLLLRSGGSAKYVAPPDSESGYLLFRQDDGLSARAFDAESLKLGNPIANIAEGVLSFDVSARGDLAYNRVAFGGTLVWVDRGGKTSSAITERPVENPRLSRDGRSVAVIIEGDVWRYDLDGRPPRRLTFDGKHLSPLWTPNGTQVISEAAEGRLAAVLADGSSTTEQASPPGHFHPHGWTRDGQIVALRWNPPGRVLDLVRFSPRSPDQIEIVLATPAEEGLAAAMSPDGRWLAYTSNETGRDEIWLREVSGSGAARRISPDGGTEPVWARKGGELFYIAGTDLMAWRVNLQDPSQYEPPVRLFDLASYALSQQPPSYDVSETGRFLMTKNDSLMTKKDFPDTPSITVILDWTARLRSAAAH